MKILLSFLMRSAFTALLIFSTLSGSCQWNAVNSGTDKNLTSIYMRDSLIGFIVGGNMNSSNTDGIVLKSTDGGNSWNTILENDSVAFTEVVAVEDTLWCFGRDGVQGLLFRSNDLGMNWVAASINFWIYEPSVSNGKVYFIDYEGKLMQLFNDSEVVVRDEPQAQYSFAEVHQDSITVLASTFGMGPYAVAVDITNNGGTNWNLSFIPSALTASNFNFSYLSHRGDIISVRTTYPSTTWTSFDNGLNWSFFSSGPEFAGVMPEPSTQFATGDDKIFFTNDYGASWSIQDTVPTQQVNNFFALNSQFVMLCGDSGMIRKTTNGGISTGIEQGRLQTQSQIKIYPNPAKGELRIAIPNSLIVEQMQLSDSSARVVKQFPGKARILNVDDLPPGSYVLSIITSNRTINEKVIVE